VTRRAPQPLGDEHRDLLGASLLGHPAASRKGRGGFFDARGVKIPVAVSAFAEEIYSELRAGFQPLW